MSLEHTACSLTSISVEAKGTSPRDIMCLRFSRLVDIGLLHAPAGLAALCDDGLAMFRKDGDCDLNRHVLILHAFTHIDIYRQTNATTTLLRRRER